MSKYYNPFFWENHPNMLVRIWMYADWKTLGSINFCQKWLLDYSTSKNETRKRIIRQIVFPMYKELTGRNYDAELLTFFNIENPKGI